MVNAFIIHTLLPGPCRVLYQQVYDVEQRDTTGTKSSDSDLRFLRKQKVQEVASEVHSEYQFRRAVSSRTVEQDMQRLSNEDTLPEMEQGFLRLPEMDNMIAVWQGTGNTCCTLVCYETENRMLAENVLKILIRFLQEHLRLLHQPIEVANKPDKVAIVLNRFLPGGQLLFMNHRMVRQLEKEMDTLMKL
ncbi:AP-5 complex subunit sigma-1-like [Mizuhopecten yessoensis]|uniref:AP-5 complex subunit sigma-1 n=1 Tax=Mizuhopecten yessoensis TaxID=6573 RepID=A0A210PDL2_MIZYE|nr:AP-5 complex subunit sigma-1-like [Mizuhopecten yessoensis]OWF34563.1 AP-5 complex subunit sigma-1 [Mizuhopecten yessoensis]